MLFMLKRNFYLLFAGLIIFSPPAVSTAQETAQKLPVSDRLIASTLKTLARTYAAVIDLEKIKAAQIHHLEGMTPQKFKKHFNKIQSVVSSLPYQFKTQYGFKEEMTKEEVILEIKKLDKKKINQMIEDIPDSFIAFQFKQYLNDLKQDMGESNVVQKIHEFWQKTISRAEK